MGEFSPPVSPDDCTLAESYARSIDQQVKCASSDMAYELTSRGMPVFDDRLREHLDAINQKKPPVADKTGALANRLYTDPKWLKTVMADRVFEAADGDYSLMIEIAEALFARGHTAMEETCLELIEEWEDRV